MMTACRQCNKVLHCMTIISDVIFSLFKEVESGSSEILRCGTARQPARELMCVNTAPFAELISLSGGIYMTNALGSLKYIS